jgi:hypothetical protein
MVSYIDGEGLLLKERKRAIRLDVMAAVILVDMRADLLSS